MTSTEANAVASKLRKAGYTNIVISRTLLTPVWWVSGWSRCNASRTVYSIQECNDLLKIEAQS